VKADTFRRQIQKGEIPQICLLYGEESLLIEETLGLIRKKLSGRREESLDEESFYAADADPSIILHSLNTFSLFGSTRLIVVRELHRMDDTGRNALLEYLENPSSKTYLVLVAEKPDMRKKFFARLQKKWPAVRFYHPYDAAATEQWIRTYLNGKGFRIDREGVQRLYEAHGKELRVLKNELDKVMLYKGTPGEIAAFEVAEITGQSREFNQFELADAVGEKDLGRSIAILNRLVLEGAPLLLLLSGLTSMVRKLRMAKCLEEEGRTDREICTALQVRYQQERFLRQVQRFEADELSRIHEWLLTIDEAIKSGRSRPEILIELLIYRICRGDLLRLGGEPVQMSCES
jgi:DNA polymerase-3 subunit delta